MKVIDWVKKLFGPRYIRPRGIILYGTVQEVLQTHKLLEHNGFKTRLVAPPPQFRLGCDLAVEFELIEQEALEALLKKERRQPHRLISTKEMLPDILKRAVFVELDGYLMCKAGNMKITVDKQDRIVNISGGGCPDIPYVAERLYLRKLSETEDPINIGNSLCSYLLQIVFDALKKERLGKC
jgi:hypothetical protein